MARAPCCCALAIVGSSRPALIMTVDEAREAVERLEAACQAVRDKGAAK